MASAAPRRRPFARFDDELQDSDQTISSVPRLLRSARPAAAAAGARESFRQLATGGGRRRLHQESAFFLETTDDDERSLARAGKLPKIQSDKTTLSLAASMPVPSARDQRTRRAPQNSAPSRRDSFARQYPRIHIGAIDFPATRSVLWDRRVLADPVVVSSSRVLPRFLLTAAVAKTLYSRHQQAAGAGPRDAPACFVRGEPIVPSHRRVKLVQVANEKGDTQSLPGGWWIPVYFMDGPDPSFSKEEYISAIKAAQHSYADEYCETLASRLQPRLVVSSSSDHAAQLDFQIEFPFSPLLLKFSLIRNLPLLMTPLAASLARHEFGTGNEARRSGYLTLDRTRKAVPLLKVDPLVFQQPIVGVWVYGVDMEEEWDDETARAQLVDPYLYFACLNYLTVRSIKERVQLATNTFLVALYPSTDTVNGHAVSPLPRFFECSISEHVRVDEFLPMELYAHRKSCFAGLSRLSSDVELAPVPTSNAPWESAKRQLDVPVIPRQPRSPTDPATIPAESEQSMPAGPSKRTSQVNDAAGELRSSLPRYNTTRGDDQEPVDGGSGFPQTEPRKSSEDVERVMGSEVDRRDSEFAAESDASALDVSELSSKTNEALSESAKESQVLSPKTTTTDGAQDDKANRRRSRRSLQSGGLSIHAHDPDNYRSCCKSQQLLAIQHQQILENQQRQLQEMQEQIAQLRRLLETTTKTKEEAKRSFNQADEGGGDNGGVKAMPVQGRDRDDADERRWSLVGSEISRLSASLRSMSRAVGPGNADDDAKSESGSSLSSLDLSSISNGSVGSDELSSLSSSLTRSRFRASAAGSTRATRRAKNAGAEDALGDSNASFASSRSAKSINQDDARADDEGDNSPSSGENAVVDEATSAVDAEGVKAADANDIEEGTDGQQTVEAPPGGSGSADRDSVSANVASIVLPRSDQSSDDDDLSTHRQGRQPPLLLLPDVYLKQKGPLLDHHGGCFTAPTPDLHSFCVPRIRFSLDDNDASAVAGSAFAASDSDSDDDLRLIEQKYRKLMAA